MKGRSVLSVVGNSLLILAFLVACTTPKPAPTPAPPTATPAPADAATVKEIVYRATSGTTYTPENAETVETTNVPSEPGAKVRYIEETHRVTQNLDSITYLGLNDDIIWPGNIVKGDKINRFVYEPIAVERAPVMLSVSLESSLNAGPSITQRVDNPRLSTVRQGISDLLKKAVTAETSVPAKVDFSAQQVRSKEDMSLVAGADVSYGGAKLTANFNWNSTTRKNKFMAKYSQIYYSIDVDQPVSPADFFGPSMTAAELQAAMPATSRPIYIAGVDYGMMALMFIESDASENDMKAALDASYSGGADVKVNGEMTAKNILESSSIKIVVYGGSTEGLNDLETGYQGFLHVIHASSQFSAKTPGVPVRYKFRHLYDNTMALTTMTSQYTVLTPIPILKKVAVSLVSVKCATCNEWWLTKPQLDSLRIGFRAYNTKKLGGALELIEWQLWPDKDGKAYTKCEKKDQLTCLFATDASAGLKPGGVISTHKETRFITFNTEPDPKTGYDYKYAKIDVEASSTYSWNAWGGRSEQGAGNLTIKSGEFISNPNQPNQGEHTFTITGPDVALEVTLKIEEVD